MTEEDNRKRSLPEPVAHAMLIKNFPEFKLKVDFLDLVSAQLESMRAAALSSYDLDKLRNIDDAMLLLQFMRAWTENHHAVEGIEEVKKKFISEPGSTKEAISKAGLIKEMGGG